MSGIFASFPSSDHHGIPHFFPLKNHQSHLTHVFCRSEVDALTLHPEYHSQSSSAVLHMKNLTKPPLLRIPSRTSRSLMPLSQCTSPACSQIIPFGAGCRNLVFRSAAFVQSEKWDLMVWFGNADGGGDGVGRGLGVTGRQVAGWQGGRVAVRPRDCVTLCRDRVAKWPSDTCVFV